MRNAMLLAMGLSLSCMGVSASAANYIDFGQEAEEVARTLTSIQSCKGMGFEVDDRSKVVAEIVDTIVRRGITHGIDRSTAEALALDAINSEKRDMEYVSRLPDHIDTAQESVVALQDQFTFWAGRCNDLTSGELSGRYIRRSGTEAAYQQQKLAAMVEQIKAAYQAD